jgi:hypothetical protein
LNVDGGDFMRIMHKARAATLAAWTVAVGMLLTQTSGTAWARKEYKDQFDANYKEFYDAAGTKTSCNICHIDMKPKKERNEYGMAYGGMLGAKMVKDKKKIDEALKGTEEKESPVAGKKFIDLIKEGKFPGGNDP